MYDRRRANSGERERRLANIDVCEAEFSEVVKLPHAIAMYVHCSCEDDSPGWDTVPYWLVRLARDNNSDHMCDKCSVF